MARFTVNLVVHHARTPLLTKVSSSCRALGQLVCQCSRVTNAEVEALAGQRVHRVRSVPAMHVGQQGIRDR